MRLKSIPVWPALEPDPPQQVRNMARIAAALKQVQMSASLRAAKGAGDGREFQSFELKATSLGSNTRSS
jgi:hypothetical protein